MSVQGTLHVYNSQSHFLELTLTQRASSLDNVARGLVAQLNVTQNRYEDECVVGAHNFTDLANFVIDSNGEFVLTVTV